VQQKKCNTAYLLAQQTLSGQNKMCCPFKTFRGILFLFSFTVSFLKKYEIQVETVGDKTHCPFSKKNTKYRSKMSKTKRTVPLKLFAAFCNYFKWELWIKIVCNRFLLSQQILCRSKLNCTVSLKLWQHRYCLIWNVNFSTKNTNYESK
jgi:hypothetical protein